MKNNNPRAEALAAALKAANEEIARLRAEVVRLKAQRSPAG